jgi:hypothetical protein
MLISNHKLYIYIRAPTNIGQFRSCNDHVRVSTIHMKYLYDNLNLLQQNNLTLDAVMIDEKKFSSDDSGIYAQIYGTFICETFPHFICCIKCKYHLPLSL